jgi:formylglycine-generating enzyme required for sulfatase activity
MLGNVWEWTGDSYFADGYLRHGERNPVVTDPSPYRVRRGGSWKDEPGSVRCANRGHRAAGAHNNRVGFRLIFTRVRGRLETRD